MTRSFADGLESRRRDCYAQAEALLHRAQADGRKTLTAAEARELSELTDTMRGLAAHIEDVRVDEARAGLGAYAHLSKSARRGRANTGATVAPIGFDPEELRHAHERLCRGESVRLEARAFTTAGPILPAELAPWVTELQHEGRILDRLPAIGIEMPSIEIIQVNSVTGSAGVVVEGQTKPEIVPQATPLTVTAYKVAAHVGLSYEALNDFDTFSNYIRIELQRQVVMEENQQLLYGDGSGGATPQLNGFFGASGILTFDATTASQGIDAIEEAIAAMRVGASLHPI
jgi:HK97 family phage major capsid protein